MKISELTTPIRPVPRMSFIQLLVMDPNEHRIFEKFTKDLLCVKKLLIIKRTQGLELCDCSSLDGFSRCYPP